MRSVLLLVRVEIVRVDVERALRNEMIVQPVRRKHRLLNLAILIVRAPSCQGLSTYQLYSFQ